MFKIKDIFLETRRSYFAHTEAMPNTERNQHIPRPNSSGILARSKYFEIVITLKLKCCLLLLSRCFLTYFRVRYNTFHKPLKLFFCQIHRVFGLWGVKTSHVPKDALVTQLLCCSLFSTSLV